MYHTRYKARCMQKLALWRINTKIIQFKNDKKLNKKASKYSFNISWHGLNLLLARYLDSHGNVSFSE